MTALNSAFWFWCSSSGCCSFPADVFFFSQGCSCKVFPARPVLFHPFPADAAGCSSRALRYNLTPDLREHRWASAPFTSALKITTIKRGFRSRRHLPLGHAKQQLSFLPKSFAGGGKNRVSAWLNQRWSLSSSVLVSARPLLGCFLLGAELKKRDFMALAKGLPGDSSELKPRKLYGQRRWFISRCITQALP